MEKHKHAPVYKKKIWQNIADVIFLYLHLTKNHLCYPELDDKGNTDLYLLSDRRTSLTAGLVQTGTCRAHLVTKKTLLDVWFSAITRCTFESTFRIIVTDSLDTGWQKTESFGVARKNETKLRTSTFLKNKGEKALRYSWMKVISSKTGPSDLKKRNKDNK